MSAVELKEQKNDIFEKVLLEPDTFSYDKGEVYTKIAENENHVFKIRLGSNKPTKIINKDATEDKQDNWPFIFFFVNNSPDIQKILIQDNTSVFSSTNVVKSIIEDSINLKISTMGLSFFMEPILEENYFWEIAKKYEGQITRITFDLISPNMANISKQLTKVDLVALRDGTNTQRSQLQLNSAPESSLVVSPDNIELQELAGYTAAGGGHATIKVKCKKTFTTKRGKKTIEAEVQVSDITQENIRDVLPSIFEV